MNRRSFLRGAAAALAAPLVPNIAIGAPIVRAIPPAAPASPILSWAVGTDGEWDWLPVKARSAEEAKTIWLGEQGQGMVCHAIEERYTLEPCGECTQCLLGDPCEEIDDEGATEPCGDCEFCAISDPAIVRQPKWDAHDASIGDAQWAEAGYGASCAGCQDETYLQHGGRINGDGRLICEYCAEKEGRELTKVEAAGGDDGIR